MLHWKMFPVWILIVDGLAVALTVAGEIPASPPVRRDQFGDAMPEGALVRMGTTRLRHGDVIKALAFSPDGKLLASGGGYLADKDIHLWNPVLGKLERSLSNDITVDGLTFSPDGRLLASVGSDHSLRLWEVSTGRQLHRGWVWSMAFTSDSKGLIFGCEDGDIGVLDTRTENVSRTFRGGGKSVGSIVCSPDGKLLVSADNDDVIRLWDMASGKVLRQWTVKNGAHRLAISPDGKILAMWGNSNLIYLYSLPSATPLGQVDAASEGALIQAVVFTPDRDSFVTIDHSRACLWSVATCKERRSARKEGFEGLCCLALTPDGKHLALAGDDHCIRFWDTATLRECTPFPRGHLRPVVALAVSPEASWLASADDGEDGTFRIWDLATGKQLHLFRVGSQVGALTLSPHGDVLVYTNVSELIRCCDPITGRQRRQLVLHEEPVSGRDHPYFFASSVDGKYLLVHARWPGLCHQDPRVYKFSFGLRKPLIFADLSHGGNTVSSVLDKNVRFWDLVAGKIRCVAFSPDGNFVATAERDGSIGVWVVKEGRLLRNCPKPLDSSQRVYSIAFSLDSKMLVAGTASGVVQLWEVETGKLRRRFVGHRGVVHAVSFCRSGQAVVSGSEDTTLLVWDVTGQLLNDAKHRTPLTTEQLGNLWTNLGDADARKAYDALCSLLASPSGVPAFILRRIRLSFQYDRTQVEKWVAQLDDEQFAVREEAKRKLKELGDQAEPALQSAMKRSSSVEQRRRVQELLSHLNRSTHPPERILALRTVELLERIGTTEAKDALRIIAKESPGIVIQQNAEAALLRLARKALPVP